MSARLDALAREKELLLMRSALCRLKLVRRTNDAREALPWNRTALAVASAPRWGRLALGLAISVAGVAPATRLVMLAGRIALVAKLAIPFIAYARSLAGPPASRIGPPLGRPSRNPLCTAPNSADRGATGSSTTDSKTET